ncbi:MAG: GDYXXLXY domain-containing protein [Clostridiaceae bacterium]
MDKLIYDFNKVNLKYKFFIVAMIPTIILISMTILPLITLYRGTEVSVLVNAYYSSDSIRGKNLYLNYKFENVPYDKLPDEIRTLDKDSLFKPVDGYVVLKQVGDIYDLDYITIEEPKNVLYLKCSISPQYIETKSGTNEITAYVNCNLDRYFVSEENFELKEFDKFEDKTNQWLYIAKIRIFKGYGYLEEVKLRK